MNRRIFLRCLGALALSPAMPIETNGVRFFIPEPKRLVPYWYQTGFGSRYLSPEYLAYTENLLREGNIEFFDKLKS